MSAVVRLEHPFTLDAVGNLKVGQLVRLSGRLFTARDRVHKYLIEGGAAPVDFTDGAIYHCGPVVVSRDGQWIVRAAGPTTSMREESFMPSIIEKHHVRVVIGKGGMGAATRRACKQFGCVYLQAVGGAGSALAARIRKVEAVHLLAEFGLAEAIWSLQVEEFEAVVTIDTHGRSLHDQVMRSSRRALKDVLSLSPAAANQE